MVQFTDFYPVSMWSGRLILPPQGDRLTDGSVFFEIHNTPKNYLYLQNRVLRLCWKHPDRLFQNEITDIRIPDCLKTDDNLNILPERLDGWKSVQPLETLAGSRKQDDVHVLLSDCEVVKETEIEYLVTKSEPIQVSSHQYTLAQVTGASQNSNTCLIQLYSQSEANFSGPVVQAVFSVPINKSIGADVKKLEEHEFNKEGYYLYGCFNAEDVFEVKAVAPRALLKVSAFTEIESKTLSQFINHENWAAKDTGTYNKYFARGKTKTSEYPKEGSGIVLHLFAWRAQTLQELPQKGGIVPGHFSFGKYSVAKCQITGEDIFDITYLQVYCQNKEGIIAGSMKWHCYMGGLKRGWLFKAPVSDCLIPLPELCENRQLSSLFSESFWKAMARVRSGNGTGCTPVDMAVSCVQDSSAALHRFILSAKLMLRESTKQTENLYPLLKRMENFLLPLRISPKRWRKLNTEMQFSPLLPEKFWKLFDALRSGNTILPRSGHDGFAKLFYNTGKPLFFIRTNIIASLKNIVPLRPTSLKNRITKAEEIFYKHQIAGVTHESL